MDIIEKINRSKLIGKVIDQLDEDELVAVITIASDYYFNKKPLLSDEIFDVLVDRLRDLNPNNKILKRTGAPVDVTQKVKLPYPMPGLNKIKSSEEKKFYDWIEKFPGPYVISDKLDGDSALLVKENGNIELYTRGDGKYGLSKTFILEKRNLFQNAKIENGYAIRGEFIISKEDYAKLNKESKVRNVVTGVIKSRKTIAGKEGKYLRFVAYEIIYPRMKPSEQFVKMTAMGLHVSVNEVYDSLTFEELSDILDQRVESSEYDIDGVVVSDNVERPYPKEIPKYRFAFKNSPTIDVEVTGVEWKIHKDGHIIPTIHFNKVIISQTNNQKSAGFNAKMIWDNNIGKGSILELTRSGDTIPYISNVIREAEEPDFPDYEYEWDDSGVNILVKDIEENDEVNMRRMLNFVTKLKIENLDEGIIRKLINHGIDDIFKLVQVKKKDLLKIDGFKERLSVKIYSNIKDKVENMNMLQLMVASNCFGRGFSHAIIKIVLLAYPDIVEEYDPDDRDMWEDRLNELENFSQIRSNRFLDNLPKFQKFYRKMSKLVKIKKYEEKKKRGKLVNKTFVFSGFRDKNLENKITEQGGKVSNSVSSKTSVLIYDAKKKATSKYTKAQELKIKIMSKNEFIKKYFPE